MQLVSRSISKTVSDREVRSNYNLFHPWLAEAGSDDADLDLRCKVFDLYLRERRDHARPGSYSLHTFEDQQEFMDGVIGFYAIITGTTHLHDTVLLWRDRVTRHCAVNIRRVQVDDFSGDAEGWRFTMHLVHPVSVGYIKPHAGEEMAEEAGLRVGSVTIRHHASGDKLTVRIQQPAQD
ncbi:hypothetical protein [Nonomuraea salmonea]|uniref:hypothetical protein n=1 Tax=Nonomuraea salmonea TaxID=46181 RepID=UPI002FE8E088